jgi:hypothetical protein
MISSQLRKLQSVKNNEKPKYNFLKKTEKNTSQPLYSGKRQVPKNVSQFNLSEILKVGNKLTFCLIQRGKHWKIFIKWIASVWVH